MQRWIGKTIVNFKKSHFHFALVVEHFYECCILEMLKKRCFCKIVRLLRCLVLLFNLTHLGLKPKILDGMLVWQSSSLEGRPVQRHASIGLK